MAEATQALKCNAFEEISSLAESDLIAFIEDTVHFLKGNKVAFLSKYYDAFGQQTRGIVPVRDFI
jgi:hypothetical protein